MKRSLRSVDIHQDQPTALAGVVQHTADRVGMNLVIDLQLKRIAGLGAQVAAHPDVVSGERMRQIRSLRILVRWREALRMIGDDVKADRGTVSPLGWTVAKSSMRG